MELETWLSSQQPNYNHKFTGCGMDFKCIQEETIVSNWDEGGPQRGPRLLKVFSPSGDTMQFTGWVGIGFTTMHSNGQDRKECRVLMLHEDGKEEILNSRCVVWCEKDREMAYSPRNLPELPEKFAIMDGKLSSWLDKNPHWPALLELEDIGGDGIYG